MRTFTVYERPGPIVTTAIHAGHDLRGDVSSACILAEDTRLREEDPATDRIAAIDATRVVVHASRFQVDLNRPREDAVYRTPDQAWGLCVWPEGGPSDEVVAGSRAEYDAFYADMERLIRGIVDRYGYAILFDVHSYNYRRGGPDAAPEPAEENPEVNIGTGSLDRARWAPVVDAAKAELYRAGYDARENVKFRGGRFPVWVNEMFPGNACALALEFKKTFIDEWSGAVDRAAVARARDALQAAADGAMAAVDAADTGFVNRGRR